MAAVFVPSPPMVEETVTFSTARHVDNELRHILGPITLPPQLSRTPTVFMYHAIGAWGDAYPFMRVITKLIGDLPGTYHISFSQNRPTNAMYRDMFDRNIKASSSHYIGHKSPEAFINAMRKARKIDAVLANAMGLSFEREARMSHETTTQRLVKEKDAAWIELEFDYHDVYLESHRWFWDLRSNKTSIREWFQWRQKKEAGKSTPTKRLLRFPHLWLRALPVEPLTPEELARVDGVFTYVRGGDAVHAGTCF